MWSNFVSYLVLAWAYLRTHFRAQLEYRGAFLSEVAAMFVNDGFWLAFWWLFFNKFPVLRGWQSQDVFTLWAITTAGFGLAFGLMGNAWHLAGLIVSGRLETWMLHPRSLLPHLLLGRSVATAWGDALFGFAVYGFLVRPDLSHMIMFALLSLLVAVVFVSFGVISASLSFFIGNGAPLADQWRNAVINFSTYPETLFRNTVKVLLFTAVPAGFISYIPVRALQSLSWSYFGIACAGALAFAALAGCIFQLGLRRYESGNLMSMNG